MLNTPKRLKLAKLSGSVYFIFTALANAIVALINGSFGWEDIVLLAFLCTPLIVNKKIYYLVFGGLLTILFAYALYYVFNMHTMYVREVYDFKSRYFSAAEAFTLGYLSCVISGFFSFLLLKVGLHTAKDKT